MAKVRAYPRAPSLRPAGATRRRLSRAVRTAAVLAALVVVSASLVAPSRADTAGKLASAQARLQHLISQIRAAAKQRAALQAEINTIAAKVGALEAQVQRVTLLVAGAERQIADTQQQMQARQGVLDERARLAYESGPGITLEFLLSAQSMADLQDRLEFVNAAAVSDEAVITELKALQARLDGKEAVLRGQESQLNQKESKVQLEENAMQAKFDQQAALLTQLTVEKASIEKQVSKLTAQEAAQLGQAFGARSNGPAISGVFLTCPVNGPHGYSDDFGAPRYTTSPPHPHGGNDIFAPKGTPIVAPFPGTASDSSGGLGGTAVSVTGALGYVYNAHLERIGKLGHVNTGTVIGWVGNTGDATGGPTHDHFEWHPNTIPKHPWKSPYGYAVVGTGIDPFPYLNSVC